MTELCEDTEEDMPEARDCTKDRGDCNGVDDDANGRTVIGTSSSDALGVDPGDGMEEAGASNFTCTFLGCGTRGSSKSAIETTNGIR